jgi:hypothetical protein
VSSAERVRVEVAFDGGQAVMLVVSDVDANALEAALEQGRDDAVSVESEGGRYTLALKRIVYIKRFARDSRVGFGAT